MTPARDACEPWLTIDLDAIAANFATLKAQAGPAEAAPVLKADAYGMGAASVALRLWAEGARTFFVARLGEGEALRSDLGPDRPCTIYTLDGCMGGMAPRLKAADLTPVLNGLDQVEAWSMAAEANAPARAALHIDTGMNRLGLRPEEARALSDAPQRLQRLNIELVISHLACGGEPGHPMNARQLESFLDVADRFPGARRSLASSGGMFLGPEYLLDMVRPGVSLYGAGPFERPDPRIRPVATLQAPILQIRTARPGESVGYGATYCVRNAQRIAVIALGYADGVLRSLSPNGYGWLAGRRCPILGRISMDLIAMDVTGIDKIAPGDLVELFGHNIAVETAAANAGSTSYEFLSRISPRVVRTYLGKPE